MNHTLSYNIKYTFLDNCYRCLYLLNKWSICKTFDENSYGFAAETRMTITERTCSELEKVCSQLKESTWPLYKEKSINLNVCILQEGATRHSRNQAQNETAQWMGTGVSYPRATSVAATVSIEHNPSAESTATGATMHSESVPATLHLGSVWRRMYLLLRFVWLLIKPSLTLPE